MRGYRYSELNEKCSNKRWTRAEKSPDNDELHNPSMQRKGKGASAKESGEKK